MRIVPLPLSFITYVCVDWCKTTMLVHSRMTVTITVLLGAPTQRWMFIQQTRVFTPSTQWCEIPAQEAALENHRQLIPPLFNCAHRNN